MNRSIKIACTALNAFFVFFILAGAPIVYGQPSSSASDKNKGQPNNPILIDRMGYTYAGGTIVTAPGVSRPHCPQPLRDPRWTDVTRRCCLRSVQNSSRGKATGTTVGDVAWLLESSLGKHPRWPGGF